MACSEVVARRSAPGARAGGLEDDACLAAGDLLRLSRASQRILGLLDASVIAARTARELGTIAGTDAAAMAIREATDLLVMRGSWHVHTPEVRSGLRIPAGDGVGGSVLRSERSLSVRDLASETFVSERLIDQVVRREGVHAILGVPVTFRGQVIGVLYAVNRSSGHVGSRVQSVTERLATSAAPALGVALQSEHASRLRAQGERQRISRDVHDHISPLLFGIGAAARRARTWLPPAAQELVAQLESIEAQASHAASSLRQILLALALSRPEEGLPATIGLDVGWFSNSTGLAAELAVVGPAQELTAEQESVLLAVVREGLHNVARHALASSVLVTLHYGPESTDVLVQDDGRGLPDDFVVEDVPKDGRHYGLASLRQRLARVGGDLALQRNEDGGMTLRGSIHTHRFGR